MSLINKLGYSDALLLKTRLQNGHYTIEKVLGQGGFGITYQAIDTDLSRLVAIKEFFPFGSSRQVNQVHPPDLMPLDDYETLKNKFIEEARALARFKHPGIVEVRRRFEENNTAYMEMEYLHGKTLGQVLHERGKIPQTKAVDFISKVGSALAVVHESNLIHRDIKPDNIMLCDDGRVVLIDFGLTKHSANSRYGTHLLTKFGVVGTEGYAPIEQYSPNTQIMPASDIYALGATLFSLISGKVPPSATERASGMNLPALQLFNLSVTPSVNTAIEWAMEIQASRRPQKVAEFLTALQPKTSVIPVNIGSPTLSPSTAPHITNNLQDAQARARQSIALWRESLAAIQQAEGIADHIIPLSSHLTDDINEAEYQIQSVTCDWAIATTVERKAASARDEIISTSRQIIDQCRIARNDAANAARKKINAEIATHNDKIQTIHRIHESSLSGAEMQVDMDIRALKALQKDTNWEHKNLWDNLWFSFPNQFAGLAFLGGFLSLLFAITLLITVRHTLNPWVFLSMGILGISLRFLISYTYNSPIWHRYHNKRIQTKKQQAIQSAQVETERWIAERIAETEKTLSVLQSLLATAERDRQKSEDALEFIMNM